MPFSSKTRQSLAPTLFALALLSSLSAQAAKYSAEAIKAQIDQALAEIAQAEMPVIVAYSIGDEPSITTAFGSLKDDGTSAADTQFDLLSITKSVTAIAILKLVEQEKLELVDSIDLYFEDVPDDKVGITVHQLLTHTSGLMDICGHDHEPLPKDGMIQCAMSSTLLVEPGSEHNYSNLGYSILAAIVEERSGKSFERYLLDDVFVGIELSHTGYESAIDESLSMRSRANETVSINSWGGQRPYWNLIGAGGLVSTPSEFLRLRQALANGEIVSPQLLDVAHTAHVPEDDSGATYYGYGVVVQSDSSVGPLIWHNGGSEEFSSDWNEIEELDLTILTIGYQVQGQSAYSALGVIRRHLRELRN